MARRKRRQPRLSEAKLFRLLRSRADKAQHGRCYLCGIIMLTSVPQEHPQYLTGDHLIPKHAGGITKAGNIVAACRYCNNGRHPELNRTKKTHDKSSWTTGDTTSYSPFAILKAKTNES